MTAMRLALATGHVDVDAMLDTLTPEEMNEWEAFFLIVGPAADSWRQTGVVAAMLNNVNVTKDKDCRQPEDFMPILQANRKPRQGEMMKPEDAAKMFAQMYGNK